MNTTLKQLTQQQTQRSLNVDGDTFHEIANPIKEHLHHPIGYSNIRELVGYLHQFKMKQEKDPKLLLVIDTDYDTDGVMSAAVLAGALDVFGIKYAVYIPTMAEGYGLNVTAINKMRQMYEVDGVKIALILTADNGTNAYEGVNYARHLGINVLVTDHHLGNTTPANALSIVNPNQHGDLYPFKGNAGACVAWKVMLLYAEMYAKESYPLIEKLIVFAGMANIADVMPILDENRYIVKESVRIINDLMERPVGKPVDYLKLSNTGYTQYDTTFYGLYDMISLLQKSRDDTRKEQGKKSIALPRNEELIGWYLSPMLNAPRRVHSTSTEAMMAFLTTDHTYRHKAIHRLIELNKEKTILRDMVLNEIDANTYTDESIVIFANTRGGISGLIAGQLQNATNKPTVVFSLDTTHTDIIYGSNAPIDKGQRISASARSNDMYPLMLMLDYVQKKAPGIVSGGGHSAAAGMSLTFGNLARFTELFNEAATIINEQVQKQLETQDVIVVPENKLYIDITNEQTISVICATTEQPETCDLNARQFKQDVLDTIDYQESLRPFGKDFNGETKFYLRFDRLIYDRNWNPQFWKTFKFDINGVEVLTFNEDWANQVKSDLEHGETILAEVQLSINEFRGRVTPQFILSPM